MPGSNLIRCEVIGCTRTIHRDKIPARHIQWICAVHWRNVPKRLKAIRKAINARALKEGWTPRLQRIDSWCWHRAVRYAIEKAMGISA